MAVYIHQSFGFTQAPGATLRYWYSWQNIAGVGPNHGPVLFTADPRSHQSSEVKLVTSDVAKCRNEPTGPPPANPGTEVFYEFSVRNDSSISAIFDLEVVWGQISNPQAPW
jgi:hypothetical protein